jgi:hypothetical protein
MTQPQCLCGANIEADGDCACCGCPPDECECDSCDACGRVCEEVCPHCGCCEEHCDGDCEDDEEAEDE